MALGLPTVLDELYPRILHCCYEDSWQARLAGAASIKLMMSQLPAAYLRQWALSTQRALLMVVRLLPEHSMVERAEVDATLTTYLRKCLFKTEDPEVCCLENSRYPCSCFI